MNKALVKKVEKELDVTFLPDTKTHKHRMEICSETSDNIYVVSQTKANGIWMCGCFGFRRHRRCKHLSAIVPVIESASKPKRIKTNAKKKTSKKPVGRKPVQKVKRETGKSKKVGKRSKPTTKRKGSQSEHLELLGLDKMPDRAQLRKAYRSRMREVHPDRGGTDERAQQIIEAYESLLEILGDE